ncbi:MAG: F0F1 ATP synthase subunit B [Candidatus Gottesmanbacteria bacterium]
MESLGIDFRMLIAQIFNFLVLLFILNKFLYKPILRYFDARKKKIEEGLVNSEKITKQLADIETKKAEILRQAQDQAKLLITQERKLAEDEKSKIIEEAKNKAVEEIKKGEVIARQELVKAKDEIKKEAVLIASLMTKKIMADLTDEDRHKLIEDTLK